MPGPMTEQEAERAVDEILKGCGTWSDVYREARFGNPARVVALDGTLTAAQLRAIADILDRMLPPPEADADERVRYATPHPWPAADEPLEHAILIGGPADGHRCNVQPGIGGVVTPIMSGPKAGGQALYERTEDFIDGRRVYRCGP